MISKFMIAELAISIMLMVAYFIYYFVQHKRKPMLLNSILWGLIGFMISNAIAQLIQIGGVWLIQSNIIPANVFFLALISGISMAVGVVFSAFFVYRTFKKKTYIEQGLTPSMIGMFTGAGILIHPFNPNSYMLRIVNFLTNALVINGTEDLSTLGLEEESLQTILDFYKNSKSFDFIAFTLSGIALALGFYFIFRLVYRVYEEEKVSRRILYPLQYGFVYFTSIEFFALVNFPPILRIVFTILFVLGTWLLDKRIHELDNETS